MIDEKNIFDQPLKNDRRIYDNIEKVTIGQGDDYTIGCLLNYPYFKENHKLIVIDLSKQQALAADPKAIQQIDFTGNLTRGGNSAMSFINEEAKKAILNFSQGIVRVL